jgi:uncharacterized membrane protein
MHWVEVFNYVFVSVVIVLITWGVLKAFRDFFRGKHHEG